MIWMKIKKFKKNIKKFGKVLKKKLKQWMAVKILHMGKIFKKLDSPLNKPIKLHLLTITVRSVFRKGGKFYPQIFLDDALYKLV